MDSKVESQKCWLAEHTDQQSAIDDHLVLLLLIFLFRCAQLKECIMCLSHFDLLVTTMYIFLFHLNIIASEAVVELTYTASVLWEVECDGLL